MPTNVLFDLDGTLTDPFEGITRCIEHALVAVGRRAPPRETLGWCIGPPLLASLRTLLGPEFEARADDALRHYRERFAAVGMFENEVYPGVRAMLRAVASTRARLFVCTSKPHVFARRILEHFALASSFVAIHGSELDGARVDKRDGIAHVLATENLAAPDTLMVGDRDVDVLGARANGVGSIAVAWGYGSREELSLARPDAWAERVEQLATVVQANLGT